MAILLPICMQINAVHAVLPRNRRSDLKNIRSSDFNENCNCIFFMWYLQEKPIGTQKYPHWLLLAFFRLILLLL